jgi:hypothetical protein
MSRVLTCLVALVLAFVASAARAQHGGDPPLAPSATPSAEPPLEPEPSAEPPLDAPPTLSPEEEADKVRPPPNMEIIALPVFGPSSLPMGGWGEMLVRITNKGAEPREGEVTVFGGLQRWAPEGGSRTTAPFKVGAGSIVSLRVPVRVSEHADPMVRARDDDGVKIFEQSFVRATDNRTLLVNVAKASVLGAALRGIPVGSRNDPWAIHGYGTTSSYGAPGSATSGTTIEVTSPLYDDTTGDPVLPRRAAGYARVAALIIRSDELVRLPAQELEALAGFVLAGGSLGVILVRPEDMRNEVIVSFVGGEVKATAVQPETTKELVLPTPPTSPGAPPGAMRLPPVAGAPEPDVAQKLSGYEGGNLHPSPYGASASYGLGEVHLLAFDPQDKPGVDSLWVQVRMVDLVRRANERVSGVLFRHGDKHVVGTEVRQLLDPNESSRWAILLTAFLLCGYAIAAGPVNFGIWRKRGRPLRALVWLAIASATTFGAVVVVGVAAKGCSGRSRHLTFIEAGAGMKTGTARRWRGFFVPSAREMSVRTGSASSVLGAEIMAHGDADKDQLRVDRDGLRLEKLALRPWETLVVREDGYGELGGGISILPVAEKELKVKNKSGHRLVGLVLSLPWGEVKYLPSLDDNESASSLKFRSVPRASTPGGPSAMPLREFSVYSIAPKLDEAAEGLTKAWTAVVASTGGRKDWFPADVPVLLAQLEGGGDRQRDTGLSVDHARVLVRVVGYGGI